MGRADPAAAAEQSQPGRRRVVQSVVGIVVLAVLARELYPRRSEISHAWRSIGWLGFGVALLLGLISVALNAGAWHSVLRGLGVRIPPAETLRVFSVSQLGKYLPGSVWPVVAQVTAGRRHGATRASMVAANLLTLLVSLCVGLTVACVFLPLGDASLLRSYWWVMFAVVPLLAMLHPRAFSSVMDRLLALLRRPPAGRPLPLGASLRSAGWSVTTWLTLGLHLYVLCAALGHSGWRPLVLCMGSMAAAICIGLLAIPVPAGAGVREAVLAVTLTTVLHSEQIAAIVLASRALLMLADLLAAGLAWLGLSRLAHAGRHAADLDR